MRIKPVPFLEMQSFLIGFVTIFRKQRTFVIDFELNENENLLLNPYWESRCNNGYSLSITAFESCL